MKRLLIPFQKTILLCLAIMLPAAALCGCAAKSGFVQIQNPEDIHGINVGVLSGSVYDSLYQEQYSDNAVSYFNTFPDEIAALKSGRIDAFNTDESTMQSMLRENSDLAAIEEPTFREQTAAAFSGQASERLLKEFNKYLAREKRAGRLDALRKDWLENYQTLSVDLKNFSGDNGTIHVGCSFDAVPLCFLNEGQPSGAEVALFADFCREYGYRPDFVSMDFPSLLSGTASGRVDVAFSAISVTDERRRSVQFSMPYFSSSTYFIIRKEAPQSGIFSGFEESFRKTFVQQNRWLLIAGGLLNTILISLCSAIGGTILGYLLYLLSRNNRGVQNILKIGTMTIDTLPTVVLLMILFYIVFGKTRISGFGISVITFSLCVALSVHDAITDAVQDIGPAQTEAALALGFDNRQTFRKVLLPQALPHILPVWQDILIDLVQGTSVVGYIAVEDLTKISDIIRSQTYEAFLPIIATALIYLLICWLLTILMRSVAIKSDPHRRSFARIVKKLQS